MTTAKTIWFGPDHPGPERAILDVHPLIRASRAKKRLTCAVCHRSSCDAPVR